MNDLDLRTQAVNLWGTGATQAADEAIAGAEAVAGELRVYTGLHSVEHYVAAGLADVAEALAYLRRARATIQPIVDARMAEERNK